MGFDVLSLQGPWITSGRISGLVVDVQNYRVIDVTFSQAMGVGVDVTANYTLSDPGQGTLSNHPDTVVHVLGNKYRLTWTSGTLFYGLDVTVTTSNMFNAVGNPVPDMSGTDTAAWALPVLSSVGSISAESSSTIIITFTSSMLAVHALLASYYTLSGTGKGTLSDSPDSVESISGAIYRLVWNSGEMLNGGSVTVNVNPLMRNFEGVLIDDPKFATTASFGVSPVVDSFSVLREFIPSFGLIADIIFSEPMGTGVTSVSNYSLSGTGKGSISTHPSSVTLLYGSTYRLIWSDGKAISSGNFTITVQNVYDVVGHLIGNPNYATDYSVPAQHNLLIQYREIIAPQLAESLETDFSSNYEDWKRLFYYWKYRRGMGGDNDIFLAVDPSLYFVEAPTEVIDE